MRNFDILKIILKWKVALIIVILSSIILSSVFSSPYFIKPKYKSIAVIYPSNLSPYGIETPTEQMLQLFQSNSIFNHIVSYFNLIKHYELDSTSSSTHYKLQKTYNENISIKKTEYEAVKIEVLDQDPDIACNIINEMINAFNDYTLKLNKEKTKEYLIIYEDQLKVKQQQIDSIKTALKELSVKYGIIDYNAQSRELAKEYYRTIATGNEKKISMLTNSLRNLEERGGEVALLIIHLSESTAEYESILAKYNTVVSDYNKHLTYTNMVVNPFPADTKSYPIRWLIVTLSVCASVFFSLILIMTIEGKQIFYKP